MKFMTVHLPWKQLTIISALRNMDTFLSIICNWLGKPTKKSYFFSGRAIKEKTFFQVTIKLKRKGGAWHGHKKNFFAVSVIQYEKKEQKSKNRTCELA